MNPISGVSGATLRPKRPPFPQREAAAQQRREHRAERELSLFVEQRARESVARRCAQLRVGELRHAVPRRHQDAALRAREGQRVQREVAGVAPEEQAVLALRPVRAMRRGAQLLQRSEEAAAILFALGQDGAEGDDEVGERGDGDVEEALLGHEAQHREEAGAVGEKNREERRRQHAGLRHRRGFEAMVGVGGGGRRSDCARFGARKNGVVDGVDHEDRFVAGRGGGDRGKELGQMGTAEAGNVLEVKARSARGYDRVAHKVQGGAIAPNGAELQIVTDGVLILLFLCVRLNTEHPRPP